MASVACFSGKKDKQSLEKAVGREGTGFPNSRGLATHYSVCGLALGEPHYCTKAPDPALMP